MSTTDEQRHRTDHLTAWIPTPGTVTRSTDQVTVTTHEQAGTRPSGQSDGARAAATGSTAVRASDEEREATVRTLHRAMAEGRLDLSETEERITTAYACTYRHELPELLADLPDSTARRLTSEEGPRDWSQIWASIVWRLRTTLFGSATAAPTAAQCRAAGLVVALTGLWFLLCALLGAGLLT